MNWKKMPSRSLCKFGLHEFWSRTSSRKTLLAKLQNRRVYAYSALDGKSVCFGFKILNKEDRQIDYHTIRLSREALSAMVDLAKQLEREKK